MRLSKWTVLIALLPLSWVVMAREVVIGYDPLPHSPDSSRQGSLLFGLQWEEEAPDSERPPKLSNQYLSRDAELAQATEEGLLKFVDAEALERTPTTVSPVIENVDPADGIYSIFPTHQYATVLSLGFFRESGEMQLNHRMDNRFYGLSLQLFYGYSEGRFNGIGIASFSQTYDYINGIMFTPGVNYAHDLCRGFQIAGIYNQCHGWLKGGQIGLFNFSDNEVKGFQFGLLNVNSYQTVRGVQCGALLNSAAHLRGIAVGSINLVDETSSGLLLGLVNYQDEGTFDGIQFGGICINEKMSGIQLGLLYNNTARAHKGLQMGLINVHDKGLYRGIQAGVFNKAEGLHGIQVGLLNYNATCGFWIPLINCGW